MVTGMTLPDLTRRRAGLTPDRLAIVDTGAGLELTYSQLEQRVSSLAAWLRDEWRIVAGDRVAVITMNGAPTLELLFACVKIGALLVPLNWRLSVSELGDVLHDCSPRALIHGPEFQEAARALARDVGTEFLLPLHGEGEGSYAHAVDGAGGRSIGIPERPHDHPWGLLYPGSTE